MGTEENPFPFEGYGDFEVYRCPCGAVGSPSMEVEHDYRPPDLVEDILCDGFLQADRGTCHVDRNYITHTDPAMLMLWAKRRLVPSG